MKLVGPASTRNFWPHDVFLGLLPLLLVFQAVIWVFYLPLGVRGVADFRQLYTGGYMIRAGHAAELYDFDSQMTFQDKLVPEASKVRLLITHPAFEELLFVPFSFLSYRVAFVIFLALNLALLAICLKLLRPRFLILYDRWRWFPLALLAAFFPISRTLLQGQDSILLLTILCGALVLLENNEWLSGLLVGVGVFRYQIAVPIALVFLLWRRWRFAAGFALSSGVAALVSLWIVGLRGAEMYVSYMLNIGVRMTTEADMVHYANTPLVMLNLRGLISAALWGHASHVSTQVAIATASVIMIITAARMSASLPLAILVASLVSYHFIAHDASIWLIPIGTALCGDSVLQAALAVAMIVAPFSAVFVFEGIKSHAYLGGVPALLLFVASAARELRIPKGGEDRERLA